MVDRGRRRAGVEADRGRAVAEINREAARLHVGVADDQLAVEGHALAERRIRAGLERRGVVDRVDRDPRLDQLRREARAVRAGPQELVLAEEVRVARVGQRAGQQVEDAHHLARRHRRAVQRQHALRRQGLDADRLQRLAARIDEARLEHVRAQREGHVLVAAGRDRRDARPLVAVDAVVDAVAVAVAGRPAGLRGPGDCEAAVLQCRHDGLELGAGALDVHLELAIEPRAVGLVLLGEDAEARSVGPGVVLPDHHEAAGAERGHVGAVLREETLVVDAELLRRRCAVRVVDLREHARPRAVGPVVAPHHHQFAAGQRDHARAVLCAHGGDVELDVGALGRPSRVHPPAEHAVGRAVLPAVGGPGHEEAAVRQRGHRRVGLVVQRDAVDHELRPHRRAGRVEALGGDPPARAVAGAARGEGLIDRDELARVRALQGGELDVLLVGAGLGVHAEVGRADGRAGGVEALGEDARAGDVGRLPAHHEPAVVQRRHRGIVLPAGLGAVDAELVALACGERRPVAGERVAERVHPLGEDPAARGVVALPDHDEGAVGQGGDGRLVLCAGGGCVGALLAAEGRGRVGAGLDPHPHQHRIGRAAVAVGQLHAQRAHRLGVVGDVAVGEVLDQQLHHLGRRRRGERDLERRARLPVAHDGPDHHAVHRDRTSAVDRDARALAQAEDVLRQVVGRVDLLDQRRRQLDVRDQQRAAVEVGAVGVGDRRRAVGVDQLGDAVDGVLDVDDLGVDALHHRVAAHRELGRVADDAVIDPVARAVARRPAGVGGPGHDIGAVAEGGNRRQVLVARRLLVDLDLAVEPAAVSGVGLGEHAARGAVGAAEIGEGHRETAAGQADHVGLALGAVDLLVDEEVGADRGPVQVVALGEDARAEEPARVGEVAGEHHHEALGRGRDPRLGLGTAHRVVHPRRYAQRGAVGAEDLDEHAGVEVAGVVEVGRLVDHHGLAVRQHRDVRRAEVLVADLLDAELRADRAAGVRETLAEDDLLEGRHVALRLPHHGPVAVGVGRERRVRLAETGRVDEDLPACRREGRVVDLRDDLAAALARAGIVDPRHHEAAGGQPDRLGVELGRDGGGVDPELAAHRRAGDVVDLREHAAVVVAGRVLVGALPDDHVARGLAGHRVKQRRDVGLGLLVVGLAVGPLLVVHRAERVVLRRDRDRRGLAQHAAGAVGDAERDQPRRLGVVGDIGVGQRLDQPLHPRGRRAGGEDDLKGRAVVPEADQRAHRNTVHRYRRAGDRHRAGGGDAELVLRRAVGRGELLLHRVVLDHGQHQPPAGEIGAVGVAERDVGEQDLRGRVQRRLVEGDGRARAGQRRRLGRRRARHALDEDPRARAVADGARRGGGEADDERLAAERGDRRLVLGGVVGVVDDEVGVDPRAGGVVDLRDDLAGAAAPHHAVEAGEGHDEAAGLQRRHVAVALGAAGGIVHPRLAAEPRARIVEALQEHALARAVGAAVVGPAHDEAAARQRRDRRVELGGDHRAVDRELGDHLDARRRHDPRVKAEIAVARIVLVGRLPHRDEIAVAQLRDRRRVLRAVGEAVELELAPARGAVRVEGAAEHAAARAVARRARRLRRPRRREAAVGQRRQADLVLVRGDLLVDQEVARERRARIVEHAAHYRLAARVARRAGPAAVAPGDHEAAARKARDARQGLLALGVDGDAELAPNRLPLQVEDLRVDAVGKLLNAVLVPADPDHDVAGRVARDRVEQRGRVAERLLARRVAVHLLVRADRRHGQVGLRRHRHGEGARPRRAAVAVADHHREVARGRGAVGAVLVGQPRQQALDQLRRRGRVERHLQRRPVLAVLRQHADGRAVHADIGALQRHAGARQEAQPVLRGAVVGAELGGEGARRADDARHQQRAAVEVRAVGVGQADHPVGVDQLRTGVRRVLAESRGLREVHQHRVGRARRRADHGLEHAPGRAVAGRAGGEGAPHGDDRAVGQLRDLGLVLRRGGLGVHQERRAVEAEVGVDPLAEHAGSAAVHAAVVGVDQHEAAVVGPEHRRVELAGGRALDRQRLAAHPRAGVVEHLRVDVGAVAGVLVAHPGDHEAALRQRRAGRQRRDRGRDLIAGGGRVHQHFARRGSAERRAVDRHQRAGRVDAPGVDAALRPVVALGVLPDDDHVAVRQRRHAREVLLARGGLVDDDLAALGLAARVEHLHNDALA